MRKKISRKEMAINDGDDHDYDDDHDYAEDDCSPSGMVFLEHEMYRYTTSGSLDTK